MIPIKVLQLGKHFHPDTGGIETVTRNISDMLIRHDIRADVLCTEVRGPYTASDQYYRVIRCASDVSVGNKRFSVDYMHQVRKLQPHYDCALIHMPNPVAVAAALAFWRKPLILLWHADIPQAWIRSATSLLDRWLVQRSDAVIGPTPMHLLSSDQARVIADKGVVIPLPFDRHAMPSPTGKTLFSHTLKAFRATRSLSVSIGRLVPYKGFDVLIEAARRFDHKLASVIVGTGPEFDNLSKQIVQAGVQDRVLMAGRLTDDELADTLAQSDFGCMPSVTAAEMYGMAQVECMAAGLPMISTALKNSGVSHVNRHNETGLIVPPRDPEALASAMLNLSDDLELRQRLAFGAQRSIVEDHDLGPVSQCYADLIRRVVDKQLH